MTPRLPFTLYSHLPCPHPIDGLWFPVMATGQSVREMGIQRVCLLVLWMFLSLPCFYLYPVFILCLELIPGSSFVFCFALLKAVASKSITGVGHELAELVEQLVDIVRRLQSQRHLPESGPDNKMNTLGMVGSAGRRKDVAGGGAREHLPTGATWICLQLKDAMFQFFYHSLYYQRGMTRSLEFFRWGRRASSSPGPILITLPNQL